MPVSRDLVLQSHEGIQSFGSEVVRKFCDWLSDLEGQPEYVTPVTFLEAFVAFRLGNWCCFTCECWFGKTSSVAECCFVQAG